ncbi:MAG: Crp/Fnr family transcriptional regulator [Anaerolineae bacterium]
MPNIPDSAAKRIIDQLLESRIFKGIPRHEIQALVEVMHLVTYPSDTLIFNKGDAGDTLYLVLKGKVRIYTTDSSGNEFTLSYMTPPRIFGDFSLIDQSPRSASAVATEPTECLTLTREAFLAYLPQHTLVGTVVMRNISERVRHVTSFLTAVNEALEMLSQGEFERAVAEISAIAADEEVSQVVQTFVQMINAVREREAQLKGTDSLQTGI